MPIDVERAGNERPTRSTLGLLGAVALSLAIISPTLAVSLNPQAMSELVGTAVPTAFLLAAIPITIIATSFAALASRFDSHGSVLELLTRAIGLRTGAWAASVLSIVYLIILPVTITAFAIFLDGGLTRMGVSDVDSRLLLAIGVGMAVLSYFLALQPVVIIGRILLSLEAVALLGIVIVAGIALSRLVGGTAPAGGAIDFGDFSLAGIAPSSIAIAVTFAILSVSGFEGAAAVGESTRSPRKNIPRALLLTGTGAIVFYVVISAIGVWALGSSPMALMELATSSSLPAAIADDYVMHGVGGLLAFAGCISSFAGTMGAIVAGARVQAALARVGAVPSRIGRIDPEGSEPVTAMRLWLVLGILMTLVIAIASSGNLFGVFDFAGEVVGQLILIVYSAVCAGAALVLHREGKSVRALLALSGVLIGAATLAFSFVPLPAGWAWLAPGLTTTVVLLGLGLSRRAYRAANTPT